MPNDKLLTITKAAKFCGYHPDTIRKLVRAGKLPDRRLPGMKKILLYASDLLKVNNGNGDA